MERTKLVERAKVVVSVPKSASEPILQKCAKKISAGHFLWRVPELLSEPAFWCVPKSLSEPN